MSGLIWFQTVWYSEGIPKNNFFEKVDFEKYQQVTMCLFVDLILYVPSTIFQLNRDESS